MSYIFQFTLCIINHLIHIVNRLIMMIIRPESPIVIPRMRQVEQATLASINTISETEPTVMPLAIFQPPTIERLVLTTGLKISCRESTNRLFNLSMKLFIIFLCNLS